MKYYKCPRCNSVCKTTNSSNILCTSPNSARISQICGGSFDVEINQIQYIEAILINKQKTEDILVTALEGGSNYWYYLKELPENLPSKGESLATRINEYIWNEGIIPIHDIENESEKLGDLSLEKIKLAIPLCLENHEHVIENFINDEYDAEDADVLFQFIVLGELTFG